MCDNYSFRQACTYARASSTNFCLNIIDTWYHDTHFYFPIILVHTLSMSNFIPDVQVSVRLSSVQYPRLLIIMSPFSNFVGQWEINSFGVDPTVGIGNFWLFYSFCHNSYQNCTLNCYREGRLLDRPPLPSHRANFCHVCIHTSFDQGESNLTSSPTVGDRFFEGEGTPLYLLRRVSTDAQIPTDGVLAHR